MKKQWELKTLDDICTIKGRIGYRGYTKQDLVEEGKGAISLSPSNIKDNKIVYKNCTYISWVKYNESPEIKIYDGDIIYCKTASIGKIALIEKLPEKATINPQFVVLKELKCSNKYLFYYLNCRAFKEQEREIIGGTAIPTLSQTNLGNLKVPLPPLPEQKRIVAILDEAFAAIGKAKAIAEQNLKNAKEFFESYLQGVFEIQGEGWEETPLKNDIELLVGFAFKSKEYTDIQDDILLLRGDNIMQSSLRWENAKRWKKSEYEDYKKYQLQESDIVLAMDRPWVKAGLKIAKLSKKDLPALLVQRTACLRVKSNLDNSFLFYLLKSTRFMNHLLNVQTGIGVPHISGQQILDFTFSRPSLKEQQRIVQKLDALSAETKKLEAIYQQKINDLEELKKSILQRAFVGQLKTKADFA